MTKHIFRFESSLPYDQDYFHARSHIKAGENYSLHWHDYFELEVVLSGSGTHIYNNKHYTLQRGSAYLMSFYDFHQLTADTDIELLQLQFNENVLPPQLNDFLVLSRNRFCVTLEEEQLAHISKLFDILHREEQRGGQFGDLLVKSLIAQIVIAVVRSASGAVDALIPGRLQQAVAYIHNHFREALNLRAVARHCNVTPNYLGAQFSQKMGLSFSDYLNTVRLRYACNLLDGTDLSGKEIAFASGYNSVEYFGFVFKKTMGVSPLEYRKKQ